MHSGLTQEEALRCLHAEGPNELAISQSRTLQRIIFGVLREPMFVLLMVGGAVYFAIGDVHEALRVGKPEESIRAMVFATIVLSNIGQIVSNRSDRRSAMAMMRVPNPALAWIAATAITQRLM